MLPQPKNYRPFKQKFRITSRVVYQGFANLSNREYTYLASQLDSFYVELFEGADKDEENFHLIGFELVPEKKTVPAGHYRIIARPHTTVIRSESYPGLVHGVQTLKQLWYLAAYDCDTEAPELPCFTLEDWPSFSWRGMHLDTSRHYFDYKFIRRYLDWMAAFKLNKFHWHLSDDQGWRLESKRFPRLHEIGSKRREADGSVYGGYHTQKQVRLVLEHASDRGIEVVPEIDIPGHAMSMLSAYPELACFPREFEPLSVWGISEDILCAGKDSVLDFLKDLLDEVMELFPGQYVHLGGDEVPKNRWKECPHCQKRIRDKGLRDEEQLQAWFLKQLVSHVQKRGKSVIGWDEILDGGIDRKPVVMCWRGDAADAARKAHDNGNRYIICPNNKLYFDWRFCDFPGTPGSFGVTTNEDVYGLDLNRYKFDNPKLFLGGQANLWTEHVENSRVLKELIDPRMHFLAELFWSDPQEKDFSECHERSWDLRGFI